jgi:hypothetical protein
MYRSSIRHALQQMLIVVGLLAGLVMQGCAGSGAGMYGAPAPVSEGMGRLVLECGGINQVNFYVLDEATDEEVYSENPRLPGSSPRGYESGGQSLPQMFDLAPGKYTVVVNTDVQDPVEVRNVEVIMGETRYVPVQLGRFQLMYYDETGTRRQVPFAIYDYGMNTVLGRGMTSTQIKYFIMPTGNYKVRLENSPSGMDEIRPVQVSLGRIQNLTIGSMAQEPQPGADDGEQDQP